MKNIGLLLLLSLITIDLSAFTIRGTIKGLQEGEMVYLYKGETGVPAHKWSLDEKVDSCRSLAGQFVIQVPDTDYGQMWLLRTRHNMIKYFFGKNENLTIEGTVNPIGLKGEKSTSGNENLLMNDIFSMLEVVNPTPIEKRSAIEWLKRHAADDIAPYALAYFYLQNKKLGYREADEIIRAFPPTQHDNPFYKNLITFHKEYGEKQADKNILPLNPESEKPQEAADTSSRWEGYKITAYVQGISDGIAELVTAKEGTLGTPAIIDTAIIKNGYFTFRGILSRPKFCNIGIRGTAFPVGFFLENSAIEVNIRLSEGRSSEGQIICLNGSQYGSSAENNYREVMELNEDGQIEQWIKTHSDDVPTLFHMATAWVNSKSPENLEKWLQIFDPEMKKYLEYQVILQQIEKRKELAIGQPAPGFTLPDINGKNIPLKKFRGKYLLIDFWASWCGPCRMEIPNLKKVYDKYHGKGLEIVSITTDRDDNAWKKAAREEKMPWFQLSANKTDVAKRYNVQGIPHILLLDKKGNIIAENLRGRKLEEALEKILK